MSVVRKYLSAAGLLSIVRTEFKKIKSPREVDPSNLGISFADCLMSAFAMFRIAPEITSYSWKIYEHPGMGVAL